MADQKISQLTQGTPLETDIIPYVDLSTNTTKKALKSELNGTDGDNAYVYIAYASDASGTDFTTTFDANLDYIAIKSTDTEIVSPVVGDFAGLWKNYKGATGATGANGSNGTDGTDGATTNPFVSVGSNAGFNYVTDGTADDVQIQQAIDAMATVGGGTVLIANEVFNISASVVMKSKVHLTGMGNYSELKAITNLNDAVISGNTTPTYFCKISNLKVNGNKANQSTSGHGIDMQFAHTWIIENIHVFESKQRGINIEGDSSNYALNNQIVLCRIEDCGGTGIHVGGYAPNNHIKNNIIGGTDQFYGIELSNDEVIVTGNHIHGTASHGIYVPATYKNNIITGNYAENLNAPGTSGIYIAGDYCRIADNVCFNWGDYGIYIDGQGNGVVNNRCFDRQGTKTQEYGIALSASSNDNTVIGNMCDENLTGTILNSGTSNMIVANNSVTSTFTSPVNFGANTAYFTETDNGNSSTADTIDWTVSNKQKSTLTGNVIYTFTAPGGPANLVLKILTGAGGFTATFPGAVKWAGGVAPTITTTASRADIITFYYDGTNYYGSYLQNYTP